MSLITDSLKGALRIGQTARTLSGTGVNWVLGERPPTPQLLRETFEKLGTTYIKLGQFVASTPSIFPDEYVEEFQKCLDNTPPIPFKTIRKLLIKELDRPPYQIFAEIDPTPLATASIAQVHAAKLITGEDVVIKVQKPGVKNILLTDLNFLFVSAKLLEMIVPKLSMASLADIVEEIQAGMLEECDFYKEAQNIEDFKQFLKDTGNKEVIAPKVYKHASSLRVLTMERFHGVAFTDLDSIKDYVDDPQHILITAMNTWFSSLMLSKSFHADVHAGNMMVLKDGRIGFIDFGIVGRIRPETWSSVTLFIQSITDGDYYGMAKSMMGIGITKQKINIAALAGDIEKLYKTVDRVTTMPTTQGTIDDKDVNKAMMDLIGIGKRYGIHFPREFALLLKQILYFDRYVQLLSPDHNLYSDERLVMLADPTSDI